VGEIVVYSLEFGVFAIEFPVFWLEIRDFKGVFAGFNGELGVREAVFGIF